MLEYGIRSQVTLLAAGLAIVLCPAAQANWVSDYDADANAAVYLPLDEGQGTQVRGMGPKAAVAQVHGRVAWAPGRYGKGLRLDGKTASIQLQPQGVDPKQGTVQMWVSAAAFGQDVCLWELGGPRGRLALRLTAKKRLVAQWSEPGQPACAVSADAAHWRAGQWRQVALLWSLHDETRLLLQLYVDGRREQLKWGKSGAGLADNQFRVGCDLKGNAHFAGVVDEVLLLDVARKPMPWAEIGGPMIHTEQTPARIESSIAAQLAPAGPRTRLQQLQGQLLFHNNRIGLAFLTQAQGFGLANVYHVPRRVGFGPKNPGGYRGLLWRLSLRTDRGRGQRQSLTNRSPSSRRAEVGRQRDGATLTLSWSGLRLEGEQAGLGVTVTVHLADDSPRAEWRIHVDNSSKRYALWEVYFPELDLGQIGPDPKDDFLLLSRAEGRCHKNPVYGWTMGYMTGSCQPSGHTYPGGAHMQFVALYERDGDYLYSGERRAGLYLATEDPQLYVKNYLHTNLPQAHMVCHELLHYPPDMVTPGSDYHMPYSYVMQTYDGDWFDACQIYRQWAVKQLWCRRGRFEDRDDVPQWFKELDTMHRADSRRGATMMFRDICRQGVKDLHPPICCHWYNWMAARQHGSHDLLSYFPPRKGIAEAWKGSRDEHIYIMPYVNAQIWGTAAASFPQARPYTIKDEFGRVRHWSGPQYAQMCRTQKWWRAVVVDACERLVKEYGADVIYLDQLGNAFNGICLDPGHGHSLGGGQHASMAARAVFEEVRQRLGWQVPVLSEASSEENIDVSAGKIIHYNVWPGFVPAFSAVYHDLWSFYGRNVGGYEGDPLGYMNAGMIFVIGGQVGRIWPGRMTSAFHGEGEPWAVSEAAFVKRMIQARKAGAKFLRYGRMLRPLQLPQETLDTVETRRYRGPKSVMSTPVVLPVVLSSVWQAADGDVGIVMVNLSDQPTAFHGLFDPGDYGLPRDGALRGVPVVGQGVEVALAAGRGHVRASLPGHGVAIVSVRGARL